MIKPTIGRVVWYRSPERPNLLSHQEVLEAIDDAQRCMRAEIAQKGQQVAALEARNRELSAPVSDEELNEAALGMAIAGMLGAETEFNREHTRVVLNEIIAARAALKGAS